MVATKDILVFGAADTIKSCTSSNNGFIKSIVMVIPALTGPGTKVDQIDILDDEDNVIYTNNNGASGWADDATHLITSISVPIDKKYTIKITLDDAAGGDHNVVVKTYINTQE